jgi:hypothetical protein
MFYTRIFRGVNPVLHSIPFLPRNATCVVAFGLALFPVRLLPAAETNFSTVSSNGVYQTATSPTDRDIANAQQVEKIRLDCIENRRLICGKIVQIQPEGLVVDSGYTNLARYPLNQSWLVPGTVVASRATNVIEGKQPDSICMGLVFLTDLPKITGRQPSLYDFVSLAAFPMGQYTYNSVGDVRRSIRRFSTKLPKAVEWQLKQNQKPDSQGK